MTSQIQAFYSTHKVIKLYMYIIVLFLLSIKNLVEAYCSEPGEREDLVKKYSESKQEAPLGSGISGRAF